LTCGFERLTILLKNRCKKAEQNKIGPLYFQDEESYQGQSLPEDYLTKENS